MEALTMPHRRKSGTRTKPVNRAAGDLAAPARGWTSLFNGGRRRPALPLPVHRSVEQSAAWKICEIPIGCVILEEIMQYTLSYLHIIQKSLRYWNSRARGSNSQHIYFMIFERGPRAFFEATCQSLTRLTGSGGPSQSLLDSAEDIISTNIDVLKSMERCLAAFLAELYSKSDICKEGLTGSRDESLHALFIVLNHVFIKLEEVLGGAVEEQALLFTHSGNPSELRFGRLPEVGTESPQWTETLSTYGLRLIYQNLQKLDNLVSSQLSSHKKPSYMTLYWLPYTCGAIGLSACSLWFLRHSSLMGSSDLDSWIGHAKESLAGFWNEHAEKPIRSVGDEPSESFKRTARSLMEKKEARQTEESLQRILHSFCEQTSKEKSGEAPMDSQSHEKEWMHQIRNLFGAMRFKNQKKDPDILHSILELDQVVKANILDLQEAILGFSPVLEAIKLNFALLALGIPLLLLLSARARAVHVQHAERRKRIAWRIIVAEQRLLEFQQSNVRGKECEARWKFGLTLYSLDRLYQAVELHANGTDAWSTRLKEHIFYLAKPGIEKDDQRDVLLRLKDMYDCSPSLRGYPTLQ